MPTDSKIFDLKILEWYLGKDDTPPANFAEAKQRLAKVIKHPSSKIEKCVFQYLYTFDYRCNSFH